MFTVKSALEQLNDHEAILERMRKILPRMDSEYPQVENRYHEGIRALKEFPTAVCMTRALIESVVSDVHWQGRHK